MANYKTPGVYIEEIVKFPPSVAQVETAIPAFIGYTEFATRKIIGDLEMLPTRITSMLEYETYFGIPLKEETISITVIKDANDNITAISAAEPTTRKPFLMYYSLQLYFANGGGPCYITSVGRYGDDSLLSSGDIAVTAVTSSELKNGLDEISKVDEPTLLLFPDATFLSSKSDFYGIFNDALSQCNKLQDRFTIIDTYTDEVSSLPGTGADDADFDLRNGLILGKDFLKYGAAYFPFLETILDYHYDESEIVVTGSGYSLLEAILDAIETVDEVKMANLLDSLIGLKSQIVTDGNLLKKNELIGVVNQIISFLQEINDELASLISRGGSGITIQPDITNLSTIITDLLQQADKLLSDETATSVLNTLLNNTSNVYNTLGIDSTAPNPDPNNSTIIDEFGTLTDSLSAMQIEVENNDPTSINDPKLYDLQDSDNALYNQIKLAISNLSLKLPPSSAMAGVYARVDNNRGVWKAPANVGLNYVVKPSVHISNDEQRDLNVDTVAGKSINAIRTFTGKGTLVWGARTLAGNDNEWRYVNVRRFFNMAEESIKKASEQFVFEPNDKNTWVRVKAMIDNFLTKQWRAGALTGATPDKAFYVSIGLGETMTAVDILEGNMIIEVGMAVVRPAEFIILKFSHKMQEA